MTSPEAIHVAAGSMPDEEIVGRVLDGDTSVFEILVRRHNQRLYRTAYAILGDRSEAEDVTQDAHVRAYEHLGQFQGRSSFATWLTRIAVHEALSRLRARQKVILREQIEDEGGFGMDAGGHRGRNPEQEAADTELRLALEKAIEGLPGVYRHVFVLREVEGMTGAETAACLGVPEATVKTRLHRARSLLRRTLLKRFGDARREVFLFLGDRCDRVTAATMARIYATRIEAGPR